MAKGKKTGGRNFEPGNRANPHGGGAISPTTRAIRKITLEHIQDVADVILDGNEETLKSLSEDPKASVLKMWLARAALNGLRTGDIKHLDAILNRTIGKPKEVVELSGKDGGPIETETKQTLVERIQILKGLK